MSSKTGDNEDMLEHQTGTEVLDEDLDPMQEEIAALGPPPGMGASAAECDEYNYAVAEIEQRYVQEALDAEAEAAEERANAAGGEPGLTDQTRRPLNVDPRANFGTGGAHKLDPGDDGTGRAAGT